MLKTRCKRKPKPRHRAYHATTCTVCDKDFKASRRDALTCGPTCRQKRKRSGQLQLASVKRHAAMLKAARKGDRSKIRRSFNA